MMKKLLCVLMISLLAVTAAACGSKDDQGQATPDSATADSAASSQASTTASGKPYATIDDYINDPDIRESVEDQYDEESSVRMSVYAYGDSLIYDYTYTVHLDESTMADAKVTLDAALEENAGMFKSVIKELKTYVDVENPKVKVYYFNDDSTIITEKVFE